MKITLFRWRGKKITSIFIFITISLCFVYLQKNEFSGSRNYARELLKKTTFAEREFLSNLFTELFYNTTIGYTLFGDKPVSLVNESSRPGADRRCFFLKLAVHLVRKYEKNLSTPNFFVIVDDDSTRVFLYLVNKKAFINVVQQNIAIFRKVLGNDVTPNNLLDSIMKKNCTFGRALRGSHALFGILFGYGTENALNFERRDQIEQLQFNQGVPPWKDPHNLDGMELEDVVLFNMRRKNIVQGEGRGILEKIAPAPGFLTLQDEVLDLTKKLSLIGGNESPLPSSIDLPAFVGNPESEETKKILHKYREQKNILTQLLEDKIFVERVLEKFYETDGV